jgi:hypothetical protein
VTYRHVTGKVVSYRLTYPSSVAISKLSVTYRLRKVIITAMILGTAGDTDSEVPQFIYKSRNFVVVEIVSKKSVLHHVADLLKPVKARG